jgi:hypothetical protein
VPTIHGIVGTFLLDATPARKLWPALFKLINRRQTQIEGSFG